MKHKFITIGVEDRTNKVIEDATKQRKRDPLLADIRPNKSNTAHLLVATGAKALGFIK